MLQRCDKFDLVSLLNPIVREIDRNTLSAADTQMRQYDQKTLVPVQLVGPPGTTLPKVYRYGFAGQPLVVPSAGKAGAESEMEHAKGFARVALVVPHLGPGGAQRVIATAANELARRGLDVHVITILDCPGNAYELNPRVRWHKRGAPPISAERSFSKGKHIPAVAPKRESRTAEVPRASALRRFLSLLTFGFVMHSRALWLRRRLREINPGAALSFLTQTNILTILATRGLGIRTVISERNDLRLQKHRRRVEVLRKATYRWADCVTANSHGAVSAMAGFVPADKLAFLPNPLPAHDNGAAVEFGAPTFITVTRLVEQKGLDVLLRACAKAFPALPSWRLAIVGDGPLREELERFADQLRIADRIEWIGHVKDPVPFLRGAEFFVLTSRFEGSPNALLEAMAAGLPAVVSDASPGPIELIGGAEAGMVVPVENIDATSEAIVQLAQDADLRKRLGDAAKDRTSGHQLENAMQTWLNILNRR